MDTAYALYFDHKRQTDPEFRKALRRESRREARAAKEEAEAQGMQQRQAINAVVQAAREEGFPTDVEDKEAYFMNEVGRGEALCQDGEFYFSSLIRILYTYVSKGSDQIEAALCFYRALKVYPQPRELIQIYDKTVPKPVIDILAEMIATDPTIDVGPFGHSLGSDTGSAAGIDN